MGHQRQFLLSAVVVLALSVAGCGAGGQPAGASPDAADLSLVAGGGGDPQGTTAQSVSLRGRPSDLEARDGRVVLMSTDVVRERTALTSVDPSGTVAHRQLPGGTSIDDIALAPDGQVYAASSSAIYRVGDAGLEPVVVTPDLAQTNPGAVEQRGLIAAITVDSDGQLVWSAGYVPSGQDPEEGWVHYEVVRLENGKPVRLAGSASTEMSRDEALAMEADPPPDVEPTDMPLASASSAIAAGDDGSIYLATESSVLRITSEGVEVVVGTGEPELPDGPFSSQDAAGRGGQWEYSAMAADGGTVAIIDKTFASESVDLESFSWSGDFGEGADELAAKIVRDPQSDGSFDLADDTGPLENVAVLVRDGRATVAMAHVSNVALDDGTLYAVGETHPFADKSEMLVVKMALPDDWS